MSKIALVNVLFLALFGCGQNESQNNIQSAKQFSFDTTRITILKMGTDNLWRFNGAISLQLTKKDLNLTDKLLSDCIRAFNENPHGTKYIELGNYRRQYLPFIDSTGERKVFVNCFCGTSSDPLFQYWKESLVEVEDGGECFFHVTISLSKRVFEQLSINGYG